MKPYSKKIEIFYSRHCNPSRSTTIILTLRKELTFASKIFLIFSKIYRHRRH